MRDNGSNRGTTGIQSVERAVDLLGRFSIERPQLTLRELTESVDLSKASVHRYVTALRESGLIRLDPASGAYSLGPTVLGLAAVARAGLPILQIAEPAVQRLVRQTNETALLSVWDGEAPVVVRSNSNTDKEVRISVRVGIRLDPINSAQAQAFLSAMDERQWPKAMRSAGSDLAARLAAVRRDGVAIHTNEAYGIRTLAAPVRLGESVEAVMALTGTVATIPEQVDSELATQLRKAVASVERPSAADVGEK